MTPVGALSIKVSVVHAHFLLNGKLRKVGILGCMLCIMGSTVILHVPAEHSIIDVSALFLLDIKCRVLVWPNYLGDVSATESERFFTKLIEKQVFKHYFEKLEECKLGLNDRVLLQRKFSPLKHKVIRFYF